MMLHARRLDVVLQRISQLCQLLLRLGMEVVPLLCALDVFQVGVSGLTWASLQAALHLGVLLGGIGLESSFDRVHGAFGLG